jgi:undecaprenyl-phosphate 4-deoxy-4-formamido-L-arabinose transferase
MNRKLSVVIPCYNSEKNIEDVVKKDIEIFEKNGIDDYEFILVNDYSKDKTWEVLSHLAKKSNSIVAINLAKNSGQHNAIMAGFHYVSGDLIVVSDDDGQTQMDKIQEMIDELNKGFDVVMTNWEQRTKRSFVRKIGTKLNDKVSRTLMDNPDDIPVSIFFLARKYIIDEIIKYDKPYTFVTGLVLRTTHNIGVVSVEQLPRQSGQSGYSFRKLMSLWLNGFTAFSIIPLRITTYLGVISAMIGFLSGIGVIIRKILNPEIMAGWSSIIAVVMIMAGLILSVLGMIGEYLGRIYMCINNTPQFVIKEVFRGE